MFWISRGADYDKKDKTDQMRNKSLKFTFLKETSKQVIRN